MTRNPAGTRSGVTGHVLKGAEWLALIAAMHYCAYRILNAATYRIEFSDTYRTVLFSSVVILGIFRLLACLWTDFRRAETQKERAGVFLKLLIAAAGTVSCALLAHRYAYVPLVYLPFLAFCLAGTDLDRVLKAYLITAGTVYAATLLCGLSGCIENLLYSSVALRGSRLRGGYGFQYPTGCAAYTVFLLLAAWAAGKRKTPVYTVSLTALALLAAWLCSYYTSSFTSTLSCLLTAFLVLYARLAEKVLSRHRGTKWIVRTADALAVGAFPLLALLTAGMTWLYGSGSALGFRLNDWMSERLNMTWTSFQKYGIHAFGALTPQSGWGGHLVKVNEYEFLDNSYSLLLIRYGWVLFLLVAFLWVRMTYRAIRGGRRELALAMAVIAFHCFSEHRFPEPHYNILLLTPLCLAARKTGEPESPGSRVPQTAAGIPPAPGKKAPAGWIAGVVTAGAFFLAAPKLLSMARTIFALKKWTGEGTQSLPALLCWILFLGGLAAFWYVLRRLLADLLEHRRPTKAALAGLAAIAVTGTAGILWANGRISRAMPKYAARTETDAQAVELALSSATQPVYAGQMEEIYQRTFPGISGRILTPEDMARTGNGTVFLEHDTEAHQLVKTGALYAEISPYTGLYTYDDAVAQKLTDAGYHFHGYYSAEREVKLSTYLQKNKVTRMKDGTLKLHDDKKHSLIHGPYLQQFSGNYVVTFSLRLADPALVDADPEKEVCLIQAAALYGKDKRANALLVAGDFESDGSLVVSLDYSVKDTRGVEFQVICREGITLYVERIAWRQEEPVDVHITYALDGRETRNMYYDPAGAPLMRPGGYYGIEIGYGNSFDWTSVTYLDENGEPAERTEGYSQVSRELNNRRQVIRQRWLDLKGNPVNVAEGYAEIRYTYGEDGKAVPAYYDASGKQVTIQ